MLTALWLSLSMHLSVFRRFHKVLVLHVVAVGGIRSAWQGGVTPIDSIVTAATAVGQWSTVKAAQTGAVNGQSGSKVQSKTRAALFMVTCRQVLQGQIADRSKVNGRKSAWSTVKTPKTAVKALTCGRSCDYSVYGSDPPLGMSSGRRRRSV